MSETPGHELDVAGLLRRARSGDAEAAWTLVVTYTPHVQRAVRRHMPREMRQVCDSSDFAQMVWASFFAGQAATREPSDFLAYLAAMARNQVCEWWRKQERRRRLSEAHAPAGQEAAGGEPVHRDDRPSQAVSARERWESLVTALPEKQQQIVRLKMQGLGDQEVADGVGVSRQYVSRVVDRLTTSYLHEA